MIGLGSGPLHKSTVWLLCLADYCAKKKSHSVWDNSTWDYETGIQREKDGISISPFRKCCKKVKVVVEFLALLLWMHIKHQSSFYIFRQLNYFVMDLEKGALRSACVVLVILITQLYFSFPAFTP